MLTRPIARRIRSALSETTKSFPKYNQKIPPAPPYAAQTPAAIGTGKCGIAVLFRTSFASRGKPNVVFERKIMPIYEQGISTDRKSREPGNGFMAEEL
jgi:hypothetical protein